MVIITTPILKLAESLARELDKLIPEKLESKTLVINFRDPKYSPDQGGFHPVEIMLSTKSENVWEINYITDFCFVGGGPYVELAKCLDFDICQDVFQDLFVCTDLAVGVEIFELWQENFTNFIALNVYQISLTFI